MTNYRNDKLKKANVCIFPPHLLSTVLVIMSNSTFHAHIKDELNARRFPSDHHELVIHIQVVLFSPTCVPEAQTPQSDCRKSNNFQKNVYR